MEILVRFTNPEIQVGDFLLPWGMVMGVLGFLSAWGVIVVMERMCWTRKVGNLPLFFVALVVICGCIAGLLLAP